MREKKANKNEISEQERKLIEQLRDHPELMDRFQSILDITGNADGPLKTADEVEDLLIEEVRHLGNLSMTQWAAQAEARVGLELKNQDPGILKRKKKR